MINDLAGTNTDMLSRSRTLSGADWGSLFVLSLKALFLLPIGGALMLLESLLPHQNHHRVRKFVWTQFISHRWPLIRLSYRYMPRGLGSCVYRFELPSSIRDCFCLTFGHAPGDNPIAFAELLDVLAFFGAPATFFCMALFCVLIQSWLVPSNPRSSPLEEKPPKSSSRLWFAD